MSLLPTKKKTQHGISLDLELEDLIRPCQMLELALVPNLPHVAHASEQSGKLLLASEREVLKPFLGRCGSTRSHVEFDAEHGTVVDEPSRWMFARWIHHAVLR